MIVLIFWILFLSLLWFPNWPRKLLIKIKIILNLISEGKTVSQTESIFIMVGETEVHFIKFDPLEENIKWEG